MSDHGYNKPDSSTFHAEQRCSGTFFPAMCEISAAAAATRELNPCSRCVPDEWKVEYWDEEEDNAD